MRRKNIVQFVFFILLGIIGQDNLVLGTENQSLTPEQQVVNTILNQVRSVASSSSTEEQKQQQIITIYQVYANHDALWKAVFPQGLGKPEFQRVKKAFEYFNAKGFSRHLSGLNHAEIKFGRVVKMANNDVNIYTTIKRQNQPELKINWILSGNKIKNLKVDDIDLVITYKEQLNSIYNESGKDPEKMVTRINAATPS